MFARNCFCYYRYMPPLPHEHREDYPAIPEQLEPHERAANDTVYEKEIPLEEESIEELLARRKAYTWVNQNMHQKETAAQKIAEIDAILARKRSQAD